MRRLGFIFTLLSLPMAAQTPYGRLNFQLLSAQGQAIAGGTVSVYTQTACGQPSTGTLATLYPDALGTTQLTQPVITDGFGSGFAYAARGCYTVVYYSPYTGTQTFPDQNVLAASATGAAGGTNTQVQYNNAGEFGGSAATLNQAGDFFTPGTVGAGQAVLSQPAISYTAAVAWGDSLTSGNQDRECAQGTGQCSWASFAATATGKTFLNEGIPGQTTSQIAVRMNAYAGGTQQQATVSGNTIPTSGGVTITFASGYDPSANQAQANNALASGVSITLCGIAGLVTQSGGVDTFTRSASGSSTACAANSQWLANLAGITGPGILEVIESGFNNRTSPNTVLADISAMTTAASARYRAGQSAGYLVAGYPNSTQDALNNNPAASTGTINQTTWASLSAAYGVNYFDLNSYMVSQYNPAQAGDVQFATGPSIPSGNIHGGAPPLSLLAWDISGTLTAAIADTTSCPTAYSQTPINTGSVINVFGSVLFFADNSEEILLTDPFGDAYATTCIRGFNGTTAATHLNGAGFTSTDGVHFGSVSTAHNPALGAVPGYQAMANGIVAAIGTAVQPKASVVVPVGNPLAIVSSDYSQAFFPVIGGTDGGGWQLGGNLKFNAGCTSCSLGTTNHPSSGVIATTTKNNGILLTGQNGQQFANAGGAWSLVTPQFALTNAGTSGYTTNNYVATTTSGAGTGMILSITGSAGKVNSVVIVFNGSGYVNGDHVFPTEGGSSADAYITITKVDGTAAYGQWVFNGVMTPTCDGCGAIGSTTQPLGALFVNDSAGANIQFTAGGGTRLQSGPGYFSLWALGAGGGIVGGGSTYPALGGTSTSRMGPLRTLGQTTGDQSLTNANGGVMQDEASGNFGFSKGIDLIGTAAPLALNGAVGTAGQVLASAGAGATPTWTSAVTATVTWWSSGFKGGGAGNAFSTNALVYYDFNIPASTPACGITYNLSTADNSTNLYNVAIYSISGSTATKVRELGAIAGTVFAPSTGVKTLNFTACASNLTAGNYALVYTAVTATAVLGNNNISLAPVYSTAGSGTTTAGALPSTFTLVSASYTTTPSISFPWFQLHP